MEEDEVSFDAQTIKNFIKFMQDNSLTNGTIANGLGDKATVKRDKHGFYKVNTVSEQTHRGV